MRPDHPRWLALASGRATFNNEVHVSGPTRVSADIKGDPDSICSLRVLPPLTQMYGPTVRCKRFRRSGALRSCINVSGLWVERLLPATMDFSAHPIS
jgi:hypothetical protein